MSKDAKAQKLAFQHWIEAVITSSPKSLCREKFKCFVSATCRATVLNSSFYTFVVHVNRLIRATDMAIACTCTTRCGVKEMLVSHSFTGKQVN